MFKSLRWVLTLLGMIGVTAALAVAAQGYHFINSMDSSATKVYVAKDVVADILPPPMYLIEARLVLSLMLEGSLPVEDGARRFDELAREYGQRVDFWKANPPFGLESKLLGAQHDAALVFLAAARSQIIEPLRSGSTESARSQLPKVHALYAQHRLGVDATVQEGNALASATMKEFESTQRMSNPAMLVTALLAAALVLGVYRAVLASIERPVHASTQAARQIAAGDLASVVSIDTGRSDSLGLLQSALQTMRSGLNQTVSLVRDVATGVANVSAEIAQGNHDLSTRTESQANALVQTSSSMETLTAAVQNNAESAMQANQLAQQAADVAQRGGTAVSQVVQTMNSINDSSRQIAGIVSVIEGIAFQTNILALNAAVEAARAGEQGRGFAVVASEVRSLAGRSGQAAKEIKSLIDASVKRVADGCNLADHAGATMSDLQQATQKVSNLLGEITSASREQASGIARVGQAVMQMDQVTQQNAALVEQMAAAASSLKSQAGDLVQQMAQFTLEAHDSRSATAPLSKPRLLSA